jgi:hypothetical protein
MEITVKWFSDNFNVDLSSSPNAPEPFLSIKGCRLVDGQNGQFVSYPAKKNEATGKWWNHCYGSEKFNAAVMEKALASMPAKAPARPARQAQRDDPDGDIPFADPLKSRAFLAL